jgi:hypothetical protein
MFPIELCAMLLVGGAILAAPLVGALILVDYIRAKVARFFAQNRSEHLLPK